MGQHRLTDGIPVRLTDEQDDGQRK